MGTCASIGVRREDGWEGTLVGYDGDPESLGSRLLDLALDLDGDLAALWKLVSAPVDGWRVAFREPYESGFWAESIERHGPPLVRHDDAIITGRGLDGELRLDGPAYWYVLDIGRRTLEIYEPPNVLDASRPHPTLLHCARLDAHGFASFDHPAESALDWRNRRKNYGRDDSASSARRLLAVLDRRIPLQGDHFALFSVNGRSPSLTPAGLMVPLQAWASSAGGLPDRVEAIAEHDQLLLFRRRFLGDLERCELALDAALTTIERLAPTKLASCEDCVTLFEQLFPFDLLELELSLDALRDAIEQRVSFAFE